MKAVYNRFQKGKIKKIGGVSHVRKGDTIQIRSGQFKKCVCRVIKNFGEYIFVDIAVKTITDREGKKYNVYRKIHSSNVSMYDNRAEKPSKTGHRLQGDKKIRFFKKTGNPIPLNYVMKSKEKAEENISQDNLQKGISTELEASIPVSEETKENISEEESIGEEKETDQISSESNEAEE